MPDWQEDPLYDSEYQDLAIARARKKLKAIEDGSQRIEPTGWLLGPIILAFLLLVLPALAFGYLAIDFETRRKPEPGLAIFLGALAAVFAISAFFVIINARPNTPKRALKIFYKAVGGGKWKRARKLVVPNDFDDMERLGPELLHLGPAARPPYVFGQPKEFERFWSELVRYHTSPYCLARISKLRVEQVSDRVAIAEFNLQLAMNTSLWWLLILINLIVAAIVDAVTRKTVKTPMRKILIRNEDDWILLNGAWEGPEEDYTGWLTGEGQ